MEATKLSTKGQVILPKTIRDAYGWDAGTELGFSLPEIRELLVLQRDEGQTCSHVRDLLRNKLTTVREKTRALAILEQQLIKGLRQCECNLKAAPCFRKSIGRPMRIEFLYFEDCPNSEPALDRLRAVLSQQGMPPEVGEIQVRDASAAAACNFPGSPTIRINGRDIDSGGRAAQTTSLACRLYAGGQPSEEMIRAALKESRE